MLQHSRSSATVATMRRRWDGRQVVPRMRSTGKRDGQLRVRCSLEALARWRAALTRPDDSLSDKARELLDTWAAERAPKAAPAATRKAPARPRRHQRSARR